VSDHGTQYGHAGRHHGIGTPDCPRELHHHHDERCERPATVALVGRRQRAREAYWDTREGSEVSAVETAIETATRVRIDEEMIAAAAEFAAAPGSAKGVYRMLAAAFRAAGFEVEE
jgi:hypothetical protein